MLFAARCRAALGMHSGDIPDDAISASSSFDPLIFGPSRARYFNFTTVCLVSRNSHFILLPRDAFSAELAGECCGNVFCP